MRSIRLPSFVPIKMDCTACQSMPRRVAERVNGVIGAVVAARWQLIAQPGATIFNRPTVVSIGRSIRISFNSRASACSTMATLYSRRKQVCPLWDFAFLLLWVSCWPGWTNPFPIAIIVRDTRCLRQPPRRAACGRWPGSQPCTSCTISSRCVRCISGRCAEQFTPRPAGAGQSAALSAAAAPPPRCQPGPRCSFRGRPRVAAYTPSSRRMRPWRTDRCCGR